MLFVLIPLGPRADLYLSRYEHPFPFRPDKTEPLSPGIRVLSFSCSAGQERSRQGKTHMINTSDRT